MLSTCCGEGHVRTSPCRYETYIVLALRNYNITVFTWLDVTLIYCTVAYTIAVGIRAVLCEDLVAEERIFTVVITLNCNYL